MSEWKEKILNELGFTYAGLSGKSKKDFGRGKPFIPFMNIMYNGKIDTKFFNYVEVYPDEKQNVVQQGDLFFTTSSETVEEVGMTSVLLEDIGECYLNSFCFGFRLHNFDDLIPELVPYLFRGNEVRKQIINLGQGYTRYNLPKRELLKKLKLNLPSIFEQHKIAQILSACDAIIEETQFAITKYIAIKQGMLHDLFTRGVDLNTGKLRPKYQESPELYKESKLGWIPREWETDMLGNEIYFELKTGGTPSTLIKEYWNGEIRWMSSGEVNKKRIYEVDGRITELGMQNSNAVYFPINSVVIGLAGQGKTRGTVAITYVETSSNQSIAAIIFNVNKVNPFFYYHLLDFQYERLRSVSAGAGRAGLSLNILSQYSVLMPKLTEQNIIAEKLESTDRKLQTEKAYLHKLQAIKQGLMGDLLSGRKRVKVNKEQTA